MPILLGFWLGRLMGFLWATSPEGNLDPLYMFEIGKLIIFFLSLVALLGGFPLLFHSQCRYIGKILIYSSIIVFVSSSFIGKALDSVRDNRFNHFASRAHMVINAIELYEKRNGHPPDKLNELVPNYTREIPHTGMGGFPEFYYSNGKDPDDRGRWRLTVYVGVTILDSLVLEYRPANDYPDWISRYGKWALVNVGVNEGLSLYAKRLGY